MRSLLRRSSAVVAVALLASGCAVGPDFTRPQPPDVSGYTPETLNTTTASADVAGGASQHLGAGQDIPGQWWQLFRSPSLDTLVRQALAANPDLQAAEASLRQARELALAQGGALYPQVDASASGARQKVSNVSTFPGMPNIYNLFNASVSVSYAVDVFGGTRRAVEAAEAQAEFQRFQLEASYLSLTANVVGAAIQEASLRGQIAATREIIATEARQLEVVRHQLELGAASRSDVLAQQAALAQTEATLPVLEKALAQQRNLLTALAGRFPSQEIEEKFDLAGLSLPQDIPLSLPSQLVEQRPDMRAAEAQLHQAGAEVGVAIANQLPRFVVSADWGSAATSIDKLFTPGTGLWSLGLGVTQPIFHGGELLHQRRAAEAAADQAAALYRSTALTAFRNVADTLRALQSDAEALRAQLAAERSAADSLELAQRQYAAGAISYLTLLNAQRTYQQARISLVQAQAIRFADTAALFQALGGGWWNRTDDKASATTEAPAAAAGDTSHPM